MKRSLADGVLFFLAMNFLGILSAVGVMFILGKLNLEKLKDLRTLAMGEAVLINPEKIKEYKEIEEKFKKKEAIEEAKTKNEVLSSSSLYDIKILALQKREDEIKIFESHIKDEGQKAKKHWQEVKQMLDEINKRQADFALEKKADQERSKSDKLKVLLKRYDSMDAVNVAMALIGTVGDPRLAPPKNKDNEEDIRVKEAAFYLKEMKPARSAEIMEAMGPLWTNALQKYMENMPIAENNIPQKAN